MGVNPIKDVLKEIIKQRESRHWTEYELAVRAGIPQSTISSWYNKNKKPNLTTLEKICKTFEIPMSQLFAESDDPICLTAKQRELLDHWSTLDEKQREIILQVIKEMK